MKKTLCILITLLVMISLLSACSNRQVIEFPERPAAESPEESIEESDEIEVASPQAEAEEPEESGTAKPEGPATLSIDAKDATPYNTKENAVPLGQWVYYQAKNYTSDEYEPFYVRILNVSRDQAEVQTAIDSYSGIMDLSLSEDQARDIEYGIIEYEIYFSPDYTASEYGITVPSIYWSANAIETTGFETDGGMSYIGVGNAYELSDDASNDRPKPGDTVRRKSLFTVLKNYDESEYLFHLTWYDGDIVAEKARELYFAVAQ